MQHINYPRQRLELYGERSLTGTCFCLNFEIGLFAIALCKDTYLSVKDIFNFSIS